MQVRGGQTNSRSASTFFSAKRTRRGTTPEKSSCVNSRAGYNRRPFRSPKQAPAASAKATGSPTRQPRRGGPPAGSAAKPRRRARASDSPEPLRGANAEQQRRGGGPPPRPNTIGAAGP